MVHHTPQGLHQESYNGVSFWGVDQKNAAGRYNWNYVASEITTSELILKETSGICLVTVLHLHG